MELECKVFDKGFNKILDLIEDVDYQLFNRFKLMMRFLPENLKDKLQKCEDVEFRNDAFNFEMLRTENSLNLDFALESPKYLKNEIYIRRLFDEDMLSDEEEIKIFSIYQRNTKKKNSPLLFKECDGVLTPFTTEDRAKEIKVELIIKKVKDSFVLIKNTNIRGLETREIKDVFKLEEMFEYLEVEDEYEEELEVYLDIDDDFNDKLNDNEI